MFLTSTTDIAPHTEPLLWTGQTSVGAPSDPYINSMERCLNIAMQHEIVKRYSSTLLRVWSCILTMRPGFDNSHGRALMKSDMEPAKSFGRCNGMSCCVSLIQITLTFGILASALATVDCLDSSTGFLADVSLAARINVGHWTLS